MDKNKIKKILNNIFSNILLINNKQVENLSKLVANILIYKSINKINDYKIDKYIIDIDIIFYKQKVLLIINIKHKNKLYLCKHIIITIDYFSKEIIIEFKKILY